MDSHDYNVFTGVKIEIFFMGLDQIFLVNNLNVNTHGKCSWRLKNVEFVCLNALQDSFCNMNHTQNVLRSYIFLTKAVVKRKRRVNKKIFENECVFAQML